MEALADSGLYFAYLDDVSAGLAQIEEADELLDRVSDFRPETVYALLSMSQLHRGTGHVDRAEALVGRAASAVHARRDGRRRRWRAVMAALAVEQARNATRARCHEQAESRLREAVALYRSLTRWRMMGFGLWLRRVATEVELAHTVGIELGRPEDAIGVLEGSLRTMAVLQAYARTRPHLFLRLYVHASTNLAYWYGASGRDAQGVRHARAAVMGARRVLANPHLHPTDEDRRTLAAAISNLAARLGGPRAADEAAALVEEAIGIRRQLVTDGEMHDRRELLTNLEEQITGIEKGEDQGRVLAATIELAELAHTIAELDEHPHDRLHAVGVLGLLGTRLMRAERNDEAYRAFTKAIGHGEAVATELSDRGDSEETAEPLAELELKIADLAIRQVLSAPSGSPEAVSAVAHAVRLHRAQLDPADPVKLDRVADVEGIAAEVYEDANHLDAARRAAASSLSTYAELVTHHVGPDHPRYDEWMLELARAGATVANLHPIGVNDPLRAKALDAIISGRRHLATIEPGKHDRSLAAALYARGYMRLNGEQVPTTEIDEFPEAAELNQRHPPEHWKREHLFTVAYCVLTSALAGRREAAINWLTDYHALAQMIPPGDIPSDAIAEITSWLLTNTARFLPEIRHAWAKITGAGNNGH